MFGVSYDLTSIYKGLKAIAVLKDSVEKNLVNFAQSNLGFDFAFVLYDVTTLYFESFTDDELRQCGFSKDNKANQPQVVIGLLVGRDGFPLSFNIFPGNILICVMSLAVAKFMELRTGKSIRSLMDSFKKITDARALNPASGEKSLWRVQIPEEVKLILQNLGLTY